MAIYEEVRKIAKSMGIETEAVDITTLLNQISVKKGGEPKGHNVMEAANAVATAMAFADVVVEPEEANTVIFEHTVSDLQEDVAVTGHAITGTLKYVDEGALPAVWGAGHFLVLKFTLPETVTSCKIGLDPSQGSGLAELVGDPDMNASFKITNVNQVVKVVIVNDGVEAIETFDISALVLEPAANEATE